MVTRTVAIRIRADQVVLEEIVSKIRKPILDRRSVCIGGEATGAIFLNCHDSPDSLYAPGLCNCADPFLLPILAFS